MTVRVALENFEGPLDLLLHLIQKHELDIFDIPVAFITEKYLEYLEHLRALNLDIAGEYLLMAATLAYIKSRQLVPTPDGPEDEAEEDAVGDPREELIRRLLEYQKYREAAAQLGDRPVMGRNVWGRGSPVEVAQAAGAPLAEVSVFKLIEALGRVLERARVKLAHDVMVDRISIADKIHVTDLHNWAGTLNTESDVNYPCYRPWLTFTVLWDGRVSLCCADFDGKTILGNLNTQTIAEIWNAETYRNVRREHLESGGPDVCRACDLPRKDSPLWITKLI